MKADLMYVVNGDKIDNYKDMGVTIEPILIPDGELFFSLNSVDAMCMSDSGEINLFIKGSKFTVKFTTELFNKVKEVLK